MSLKFPNVRLFLFDLLTTGGLSGPEAIARTACEYGIIPADSIDAVLTQSSSVRGCKCVSTLKNILHEHFAAKKQQSSPDIDANEVWDAIEADAVKHQKHSHLRDSPECSDVPSTSSCLVSAPTLFDFLLQHIRRYP